MNFVTG